MKQRRLTASDVCEVTGYTRDQLKALLKELPGWSAPSARVARQFSPHELIVMAVVHALDVRVGMRRKHIAALLPGLVKALAGPRRFSPAATLVFSFEPLSVGYISGRAIVDDGVVIALEPILDRVDHYLGLPHAKRDVQRALRLGPGLLKNGRGRAATGH